MSKPSKILIDTCFLISLVNEQDGLHTNAEDYFRHFIAERADLFISTIALAEFMERQGELEIIENFKVLSFDMDEARALNKHFSRADVNANGSTAQSRIAFKDDMKIVATALSREIDSILSANNDLNKIAMEKGLKVIDYGRPLSIYLGTLF
jgi:predicted nucleic acid-binding protein